MKKKDFESKLGREICDQTWYRLNAKLRAFGLQKKVNNGDYTDALTLLAEISKRTGKKIDVESFIKVWGLIKSDKKLPENLDGNQLREYILSSLPVKPCPSVFYRWFESAGHPFKSSKIYEQNVVIRVVAYAHNWLTKKTPGCKTGQQQQSYTPINLSDFTPFSELINESEGN